MPTASDKLPSEVDSTLDETPVEEIIRPMTPPGLGGTGFDEFTNSLILTLTAELLDASSELEKSTLFSLMIEANKNLEEMSRTSSQSSSSTGISTLSDLDLLEGTEKISSTSRSSSPTASMLEVSTVDLDWSESDEEIEPSNSIMTDIFLDFEFKGIEVTSENATSKRSQEDFYNENLLPNATFMQIAKPDFVESDYEKTDELSSLSWKAIQAPKSSFNVVGYERGQHLQDSFDENTCLNAMVTGLVTPLNFSWDNDGSQKLRSSFDDENYDLDISLKGTIVGTAYCSICEDWYCTTVENHMREYHWWFTTSEPFSKIVGHERKRNDPYYSDGNSSLNAMAKGLAEPLNPRWDERPQMIQNVEFPNNDDQHHIAYELVQQVEESHPGYFERPYCSIYDKHYGTSVQTDMENYHWWFPTDLPQYE